MVKYHISVSKYLHDGGEPTDYTKTIETALNGAKELIKAGYLALTEDVRIYKPIFERYFGTMAESKRDAVRCKPPMFLELAPY